MKAIVLMCGALLINSGFAMANDKCLSEAGLHARLFSGKENQVSVKDVNVKDAYFHSEERGILYYAVLLNTREKLNVGVSKKDCSLKHINYVTND